MPASEEPTGEFHLSPSRTGEPSARVGGLSLHSSFDPSREADRYIAQAGIASSRTELVVLLGPGLGYLVRHIRSRLPNARVVCLFFSAWCRRNAIELGDVNWDPSDSEAAVRVVARELSRVPVENSRILTWPPSKRAFASVCHQLEQRIAELFRERQATTLTEGYFGTRWIKNTIANLSRCPAVAHAPHGSGTVVIAASGPSLEETAGTIASVRNRVQLWALPSAVSPLLARGLSPDLVVLTDPGFYATRHLRPLRANGTIPIAMPLTAARGTWTYTRIVIPLRQAMPFEEAAYTQASMKGPSLPEVGTVAGTALELALSCGFDRVVFAGLDMCTRDTQSHARPDELQRYRPLPNRVNPISSGYFRSLFGSVRVARGVYAPRSLEIYAAWFRRRAADLPNRLYRLRPSPIDVGIPEIDAHSLMELPRGIVREPEPQTAPTAERRLQAACYVAELAIRETSSALDKAASGKELTPDERWLLRAVHLPSMLSLSNASTDRERSESLRRLSAHAARFQERLTAYTEASARAS